MFQVEPAAIVSSRRNLINEDLRRECNFGLPAKLMPATANKKNLFCDGFEICGREILMFDLLRASGLKATSAEA